MWKVLVDEDRHLSGVGGREGEREGGREGGRVCEEVKGNQHS